MRPSVLLALALALGCQHRNAPARPETSPPSVGARAADVSPPADVAPAPTAGADAATAPRPGTARLLALADQIAGDLARQRGLAIMRPLQRGVMGRPAIVARLRERVAEEYPDGEITLEGELLRRLGLLPEGMDYERTMFELLEEQVAGFYDPHDRTLYIADWVPADAQPVTMAHEITHALQDQHFDIARFTHHERGRGDAQTAAMAVVEGDATAAMTDFLLAPAGRSVRALPDPEAMFRAQALGATDPRLAAAPRAIRETLLFPYITGFGLCARLEREADSHAPVDALLRTPPASTEQVLHADKLATREAPVTVTPAVPAPLAGAWAVAYHDVVGEFQSRLFFYGALPDAEAHAAAAGWGGDHAVLLAPRALVRTSADGGARVTDGGLGQTALVWTVVLDRGPRGREDADAVEFAEGAARVLAHRYGRAPEATIAGAQAARDVGDGRVSLVARAGRTVLVADRLPAASAAAVVRAVVAAPRR